MPHSLILKRGHDSRVNKRDARTMGALAAYNLTLAARETVHPVDLGGLFSVAYASYTPIKVPERMHLPALSRR